MLPLLSVALHADALVHPGLSVRGALETPGPWALAGEVETGGWWHPHHLVGMYLRAGPALTWRHEHARLGVFTHLGGLYGLWAAPSYRVDAGEVERAGLAGRGWGWLSTGLSLGWQGERLDGWLRPQLGARPGTFWGWGLDPALQVGVSWRLP
jgi:hypothetical protein